jgi:hypothetical protein
MTNHQRMFTPPRLQILPSSVSWVRVALHLILYLLFAHALISLGGLILYMSKGLELSLLCTFVY